MLFDLPFAVCRLLFVIPPLYELFMNPLLHLYGSGRTLFV